MYHGREGDGGSNEKVPPMAFIWVQMEILRECLKKYLEQREITLISN
jgi:hypothetical protein